MLLAGGMTTQVDLDIFHSMALARETLREGSVPWQDRFAYTPTVSPSVHHEWGMGMLLYGLAEAAGAPGLLVARLLLALLVCTLAWRLAVRRGAGSGVLALLAPIAIVMSWIAWTLLRPQIVTLLFVVVLLGCLEADRRGSRRWIAPWLLGSVVWVNLHGGVAVGVAILLLEALERAWRGERPWHLVATTAGMLAALVLTPYGWAYYPYLWHALAMDRSLITEWRSLAYAKLPSLATVALALLIAAYALAKVGLRRAVGWPLLAAAAYEAVRHERHVSLFALVWFAQVPALVSATRLGEMLERFYARAGVAVMAGLLVLGLALGVQTEAWRVRIPGTEGEARYPVGPVDRLAELGFQGNALVPFSAGAYVVWKLAPAVRVSIDSRYEAAYPHAALADHLDFFYAAPRWRSVLASMPATDVVLVPRRTTIGGLLAREPGWTAAYEDDGWVMFARPGLSIPYTDRRGQRIEGTFP